MTINDPFTHEREENPAILDSVARVNGVYDEEIARLIDELRLILERDASDESQEVTPSDSLSD